MSDEEKSIFKTIYSAHIGDALDSERVEAALIEKKGAVRYRDAYYVKFPVGEAWCFDYGVVVCWDLSIDARRQLVLDLEKVVLNAVKEDFSEQYSFRVDTDKAFKIQHDFIVLDSDDKLTRLALSHAFAQSTKLQVFEDSAQGVIQRNAWVSRDLASTGQIPMTRRELAKLRGTLYATSSDISLHFNLLDTPEFFWDYPELELYYLALAKYLDLKPRIEILNHKLETIHALLDMLASEQHHKHSAFLEWIIIVLIAVDILIYFLPGH